MPTGEYWPSSPTSAIHGFEASRSYPSGDEPSGAGWTRCWPCGSAANGCTPQNPCELPSWWPQSAQKMRVPIDGAPIGPRRQSEPPQTGQRPSSVGPSCFSSAFCVLDRRSAARARSRGMRGTRRPAWSVNRTGGRPRGGRPRPAVLRVMKATQAPFSVAARHQTPPSSRTSTVTAPGIRRPPVAAQSGRASSCPAICAGSMPSSRVPPTRSACTSRQCDIQRSPSWSMRTPARCSSRRASTNTGLFSSTAGTSTPEPRAAQGLVPCATCSNAAPPANPSQPQAPRVPAWTAVGRIAAATTTCSRLERRRRAHARCPLPWPPSAWGAPRAAR